jgi:hypothetical protein
MNRPAPKNDVDLTDLYALCEEYIDYIESDEYSEDGDSDYEYYFYESVLTTIFGDDIFEYITEKCQDR